MIVTKVYFQWVIDFKPNCGDFASNDNHKTNNNSLFFMSSIRFLNHCIDLKAWRKTKNQITLRIEKKQGTCGGDETAAMFRRH